MPRLITRQEGSVMINVNRMLVRRGRDLQIRKTSTKNPGERGRFYLWETVTGYVSKRDVDLYGYEQYLIRLRGDDDDEI